MQTSLINNRNNFTINNRPFRNKYVSNPTFTGDTQNKFLNNFDTFLKNPENRDQKKVGKFINKSTGKSFKPILNSEKTINKLLKDKYTSDNTDFHSELAKINDKVFDDEICFTHGNNAQPLMKKLGGIMRQYGKDLKPKQRKNDNFGDIYEDIAASSVKSKIIPQIAEKISRNENISKKEALSQLKQVNGVRLSRSTEFDHLILRIKNPPAINEKGQKTYKNFDVVGVVETKYDPALVKHGYDRRIEDLSWLKNSCDNYDRRKYDEKFNGKTVFDEESNSYFHFSPSTFKNINTDKDSRKGYKDIYFVTSNLSLVEMNEKVAKKMIDSPSDIEDVAISNKLDNDAKSIYKKYKKYDLSDNIIFTNDDYCGFSLLSVILFHKVRDICNKKDIDFPEYKKINEYSELQKLTKQS